MYMVIGTLFDPLLAIPALLIGYFMRGTPRLVVTLVFMVCFVLAGNAAGLAPAADRVGISIIAVGVLVWVGSIIGSARDRSQIAREKTSSDG